MLRIDRLSQPERLVVGLLRGVVPATLSDPDRPIFAHLHLTARNEGLTLLPPANPFLSQHEARLLGTLATLQRRKPRPAPATGGALAEALSVSARRLVALDIIIDARNVVRLPSPEPASTPSGRRPPPRTIRSFKPPVSASLQDRVLRFVALHGRAESRLLQAFGASRQVISIMFQRRLLDRERAGLYRLSPEAMAWLKTQSTED